MIEGRGLHTGAPASVRFIEDPGPVRFRSNGITVPLDALEADDAERSTRVRGAGLVVRTVEHLLAALGGLGIRDGLVVEVDGPEIPIMDGGARAFVDALAGFAPSAPSARIVASGRVVVGASEYTFAPGPMRVEVAIDFGDDRLAPHAGWDGDPSDFRDRIATARTFGFAHEVETLAERGLARHVPPSSVVVIGDVILAAGAPFTPDEPARHKLLDLVGDAYIHGGPFEGQLRATRPGHAATHAAMRHAWACGWLERVGEKREVTRV